MPVYLQQSSLKPNTHSLNGSLSFNGHTHKTHKPGLSILAQKLTFVLEADLGLVRNPPIPPPPKKKLFCHDRLLFAAAAFFLCRRSRRLRPSVSPACAAFGFPFFFSPNAVPSSSSSVCRENGWGGGHRQSGQEKWPQHQK